MLEEGCCKSDTRCGTAGSLSNGLLVTCKVSQIIESSTSSYQNIGSRPTRVFICFVTINFWLLIFFLLQSTSFQFCFQLYFISLTLLTMLHLGMV
jgi:hypothetical protein